jgi:hypothetical protein
MSRCTDCGIALTNDTRVTVYANGQEFCIDCFLKSHATATYSKFKCTDSKFASVKYRCALCKYEMCLSHSGTHVVMNKYACHAGHARDLIKLHKATTAPPPAPTYLFPMGNWYVMPTLVVNTTPKPDTPIHPETPTFTRS